VAPAGPAAPTAPTSTTRPTAPPAGYPLEQLQPSAAPPRGTPAGILAQADVEAQRIRELARAEGHAEGFARGRTDGLTETRAAAQALQAALTQLQARAQDLADTVERDAVELALALAGKILAGAFDVEPQRVLDVVAGALRRVADRRSVTVLVNPDDLELVESAVGELRGQAGGIELCDVQADRRVSRGGAIVRTRESEVDATVQTQLARAREVIRAELGCGEAEAAPSEAAPLDATTLDATTLDATTADATAPDATTLDAPVIEATVIEDSGL